MKQRSVLIFIEDYVREHSRAPLIREVQAGCRIVSYKSAIDRLTALERKGFIRRRQHKHRGIFLLKRAPDPKPAVQPAMPLLEAT
ncbi:MAG TPA: LexA repressor [bacterium]